MKSSLKYDVVCFGEVLWDVLPSGALPGGAPMNVAYHLKKLGASAALITRVGEDNYGSELVKMLLEEGIHLECEIDSTQPTGLVNVVEGDNHEMTYEIAFPAAWDFIRWHQHYEDLVASAAYFVFGTLSNRYHVTRETLHRLIPLAQKNVMDVNLRPPHFQLPGIEVLLKETDLLKMNLAELHLMTDSFGRGGHIEDRLKFLRQRFEIGTIIVTKGGDGAVILSEEGIISHPGYKVKVQDTIGSGDSFLAGFLARTLQGGSTEEALDFAAATGAFVATKTGGTPAYKAEEIRTLTEAR